MSEDENKPEIVKILAITELHQVLCAKCEGSQLVFNGQSGKEGYGHHCTQCGGVYFFESKYPCYVHSVPEKLEPEPEPKTSSNSPKPKSPSKKSKRGGS